MDSGLAMEKQVNAISKSCFYHIQNIGKVRQYITNDAYKILVQALVTSRLDYGLQGLPQVLIERLQHMQNCTAHLITRSCKSEHITPVLPENIKQLNTLSSFKRHLKHISLNWHTTDVIEPCSRFNEIAIYQ